MRRAAGAEDFCDAQSVIRQRRLSNPYAQRRSSCPFAAKRCVLSLFACSATPPLHVLTAASSHRTRCLLADLRRGRQCTGSRQSSLTARSTWPTSYGTRRGVCTATPPDQPQPAAPARPRRCVTPSRIRTSAVERGRSIMRSAARPRRLAAHGVSTSLLSLSPSANSRRLELHRR